MAEEDDKIWPNMATGLAPKTLGNALLEEGPDILRHKTSGNEQRLQYPGDEKHNKGKHGEHNSHREGRAVDIVLFNTSPSERAEAEILLEIFLELRTEMGWSTMIYNKREWNSEGKVMPRTFRAITSAEQADKKKTSQYWLSKAVFEHHTHIHVEWILAEKDRTAFKDKLLGKLKEKKAAIESLEKVPTTLRGQWEVVWGNNDFTGYMKFTENGSVTYSGKRNGNATNSGTWNIQSGSLVWKFAADPDDIRTFVAKLPLDPGGTAGVIRPAGQGWFNMTKV